MSPIADKLKTVPGVNLLKLDEFINSTNNLNIFKLEDLVCTFNENLPKKKRAQH